MKSPASHFFIPALGWYKYDTKAENLVQLPEFRSMRFHVKQIALGGRLAEAEIWAKRMPIWVENSFAHDHTHTLACAQYLAKPCKWRTPISLNAQASAGKGWSRRNLEALDASKKAFHWAFEIGDSGSSQAKSRWLQSSPPAKWGWTKCPLYVATPLSYYLWIGTENAAARATYVQTAPKTWSISQLYINWAVGELFFVHKIGGVPHEHPSVLLPPPACGQKSHDRGQDWCVACVASGHELIEIFRKFHGTRQTAWDGWDKVGWVEEAWWAHVEKFGWLHDACMLLSSLKPGQPWNRQNQRYKSISSNRPETFFNILPESFLFHFLYLAKSANLCFHQAATAEGMHSIPTLFVAIRSMLLIAA